MAMTPEQKKSNVRLGLILATVALAILVGFVAKLMLLQH
ncbi:cytochrome oxidase small assembly protein [Limnohabitans sp. Jir72]